QVMRAAPGWSPRLGSGKGFSVNRHLLIRQFSYDCRGKDALHECVAFKNHLFAHSGRSELLKGLDCSLVKILPGRHWSNELHERKPTDKLRPAGCQVKCQRGSPVVRDDERRLDSSAIEKCIEVPYMIGKPILDVGFSGLAEPDEIRCDAMRHRRNQRKNIPPYVRRRRVPVQKQRDWCVAISRFPVGHRGSQNIYLGQCNIREDSHFCSLNTVWKAIFLKRSSAAGPR